MLGCWYRADAPHMVRFHEIHMSSLEEDPKEVARKEAKTPEVQRLLRQFLTLDGPKGNSKNYKENLEKALENKCLDCDGFGTIGISGKYVRSEEKCPSCDGTGKKTL